jgi:hypothetical protein
MQKAPANDICVGQRIWFESSIFANGKSTERDIGGGRTVGVKRYAGEVLGISGWEKNLVRFSVGDGGQEDFQLWAPICWTALGFVLRVRHYMLRYQLVDTIPPPPRENRMEGQERRVEPSLCAYHRQARMVQELEPM